MHCFEGWFKTALFMLRNLIWIWLDEYFPQFSKCKKEQDTRSSWLNCALRDDEAVYWVSIGHYQAVAVGNWWYWVSRGHACLYILNKVEIWTGVTDAWLTHWLTDFERLIKYKSGALVTQWKQIMINYKIYLNVRKGPHNKSMISSKQSSRTPIPHEILG